MSRPPRRVFDASTNQDVAYWTLLLWPYAKPNDSLPKLKGDQAKMHNTVFNCLETTQYPPEAYSFGWIYAYNTWLRDTSGAEIYQNANKSSRLTDIMRSADVFLFVEQCDKSGSGWHWSHYTTNRIEHPDTDLLNHHLGSTNAAFVDGHAKFMTYNDWPRESDGAYANEHYSPDWTGK